MPIYETVYILRPDLSKNQAEQINKDFKEIISKVDATVKFGREEYWGVRTLAYRIRKQRKGHYLMFNYEGQAAIVPELERRMRLSEDLLRYMTVALHEMPTEPSIMMKTAEEDDTVRRPRRDNRSFDNSDGIKTNVPTDNVPADNVPADNVVAEKIDGKVDEKIDAPIDAPAETAVADSDDTDASTADDADKKTEKEQE